MLTILAAHDILNESLRYISEKHKCDSGSVGGVQPCQGWGRGFESRLSLLRLLRNQELFLLSKIEIVDTIVVVENEVSACENLQGKE